jgi:acetyl esterase/lipase
MTDVAHHRAATFTTEDVEYRRVDGRPLLARIYKPHGPGPFPAAVSIHGGAWTSGDRTQNQAIDQALAAAGAVVVDLDFRMAPKFRYPASVADVNDGIRWLKNHAAALDTRADWIGAIGTSSGGHQMLLNALQPGNPRYASDDAASADAGISYGVACWPIADPLARYRMAVARGNERLIAAHDAFFPSEATMAEANPQLILERAETVRLPPLLVLQGTKDDNVTPDMAEKFVATYRAAGGRAKLELFEGEPHTFVTKDPSTPASVKAIELICGFVLARGTNV